MAPDVVTASQSEEDRILPDTLSGPALHAKYASGCEEVSGSEEDSGSEEACYPATTSPYVLSDEADSADSTPAPLTGVPAPVADQPNWWCV